MVKLKRVFERKEKKYLLSLADFELLSEFLDPYMEEDQFGLHTIISVYYDTDDYRMINRSIEKPKYKEKFRLRSYGVPQNSSEAFLEIKKKVRGVVYKRRVALSYEAAKNYHLVKNSQEVVAHKDQQIRNEIDWLIARQKITPKVMIAYDRRAYQLRDEQENDFRVTFDFNIRYRTNDLDISHGSQGKLVAPDVEVLMEVKALGAYPVWFTEILSELGIYAGTFSKYAQTYLRHLSKEEMQHVI
ncbi:VTC domain-containing protein [Enterococcus sp. LJL120]